VFITLTADGWLALAYLLVAWGVARATRQETSMLLACLIAVSVTAQPSSMLVVVVIGLSLQLLKLMGVRI
jgi:hypothetical protein